MLVEIKSRGGAQLRSHPEKAVYLECGQAASCDWEVSRRSVGKTPDVCWLPHTTHQSIVAWCTGLGAHSGSFCSGVEHNAGKRGDTAARLRSRKYLDRKTTYPVAYLGLSDINRA